MCEQQQHLPLEKKSSRSKNNSSDSNIYLGSHGSHNDDEEISLQLYDQDEDDLDEEDSEEEFDRDVR